MVCAMQRRSLECGTAEFKSQFNMKP
jgi:hypothetical protein